MEIQPIQILLQMVNFGLVVFVLVKFLYNPISKVLEARSEKIKEGMDSAEKNIAEKQKLDSLIKTELAKARKDAAKLLSDTKKQAETEAQEIISTAKAQAKKAASNEQESFDTMLAEAKQKAEKEIKQLVTATTAQVLKNGLTEAEQHKIIESQIKLLKEVKFV